MKVESRKRGCSSLKIPVPSVTLDCLLRVREGFEGVRGERFEIGVQWGKELSMAI